MSPSPPAAIRAPSPEALGGAKMPRDDGVEDNTSTASNRESVATRPRVGPESEVSHEAETQSHLEELVRSRSQTGAIPPGLSDEFDPLELASGFQFAPPATLAPGQFTRRTIVNTRLDEMPVPPRIPQVGAGIDNQQVSSNVITQPRESTWGSIVDQGDRITALGAAPLEAPPIQIETYSQDTQLGGKATRAGGQHAALEAALPWRPFSDDMASVSRPAGPEVRQSTAPSMFNRPSRDEQAQTSRDQSIHVGTTRPSLAPDARRPGGGCEHFGTRMSDHCGAQKDDSHEDSQQNNHMVGGSNDPSCPRDLQFPGSIRDNEPVTPRDSAQSDVSRRASRSRENSRSQFGSSPISNISKLRSMPTRHGKAKLERVKQFGSHFAHSWNSYVQDVSKAEEQLEAEFLYRLDKLKRKNEDQERQIIRHIKKIDSQAKAIGSLGKDKQELTNRVATMENELQGYSERVNNLEAKCRSYKGFLNAAIEEQQRLYNRSRKVCQETIDKIRAEEQLQNASIELARQKAESLREHILEKVRVVIAQSKEEARHMTDKIQALSRDVEEKEYQIKRERERSENLLEQLDEKAKTQKCFELVQVKLDGILDSLGKHHTQEAQGARAAQDASQAKLDIMIEHIQTLKEIITPQSDAVSAFSRHQEEGISNVVEKLEIILDDRKLIERLPLDLKEYVGEMWKKLEKREDALTQQLSEKRSENALVTRVLEEREEEFQTLEAQLEGAKVVNSQQEERIRQLTVKIAELEARPRFDSGETIRCKSLEHENSRLRGEVETKGAAIADLEKKLQEKDDSYLAEARKFSNDIDKLTQLMHNQQSAARATTDRAVEDTRRQLRLEMEKTQQETRDSLRIAEKQRLDLQAQVQDTMIKLASREQRERDQSSMILSLQEALTNAEHRINILSGEGQKRNDNSNTDNGPDGTTGNTTKENLASSPTTPADIAVHAVGGSLSQNIVLWTQASGVNRDTAVDLERLINHCIKSTDFGPRLHNFLESALTETIPQPNRLQVRYQAEDGALNTALPLDGALVPKGTSEQEIPCNLTGSNRTGTNQNAEGAASDTNGPVPTPADCIQSSSPLSDAPLSPSGPKVLINQEQAKRVVIKSPSNGQLIPISLTVEQEKARRREAVQLKSIIKSHAEPDGEIIPDSSQERISVAGVIPDYGSFLRGPYNRPVAGRQVETQGTTSGNTGQRGGSANPKAARAPKRRSSSGGPRATKKSRRGPGGLETTAESSSSPLLQQPKNTLGITPYGELGPVSAPAKLGVVAKTVLPNRDSPLGPARVTRSTQARRNILEAADSANYQGPYSLPSMSQRENFASGQRAKGGPSNASFRTAIKSSQGAP